MGFDPGSVAFEREPRVSKAILISWLIAFSLPLAAGPRAPEHPVDLNAATATELMELPRVGARTAARIVAFRQEHGRFRRPEELMNIKGIGEKAFRRLQPHVTVGEGVDHGPR
jgi:competence protein ComEA